MPGQSSVTVEELRDLVDKIFKTKAECEKLDEALSEKNKELQAAEGKCVEYLKELGLDTFKTPFGSVTPAERTSYAVPKGPEERTKFFDYLKEQGLFENLITVNYQTLNSYAKEWYEQAKNRGDIFASLPGLGAPTISPYLHKTKARQK